MYGHEILATVELQSSSSSRFVDLEINATPRVGLNVPRSISLPRKVTRQNWRILEPFMRTTDYQAKYFAYDLTRRCAPDSADRLAGAVAGAQVDLNPHQVDAALFAFASPLSKGALLADEVGLGKTIEAGLVISQRWAERRRRILVIAPSNLRKQWHQELSEKFFLPCAILESKSYNAALKAGNFRPFDMNDMVVICSYQFARAKASDVHAAPWDLVVIDEAHRLRNVYKPSNVIANTLKNALAQKQKLLLTATPLQNSLLELYGLISFIDEHTFAARSSGIVNGSTTPRGTRYVFAAGVAGLMFKTGRCPGRVRSRRRNDRRRNAAIAPLIAPASRFFQCSRPPKKNRPNE
jgi:hypothetical protein